jgi:hypothetical protein
MFPPGIDFTEAPLFFCGPNTINRYQGIVDTIVQLFGHPPSGLMAFMSLDSIGLRTTKDEGEGHVDNEDLLRVVRKSDGEWSRVVNSDTGSTLLA